MLTRDTGESLNVRSMVSAIIFLPLACLCFWADPRHSQRFHFWERPKRPAMKKQDISVISATQPCNSTRSCNKAKSLKLVNNSHACKQEIPSTITKRNLTRGSKTLSKAPTSGASCLDCFAIRPLPEMKFLTVPGGWPEKRGKQDSKKKGQTQCMRMRWSSGSGQIFSQTTAPTHS